MAEFDRKELERKLARVLSKDLQAELKKLLDYLGDPPNLLNVPDLYWQTGWKLIAKHVEPLLVDYFIQVALKAMDEVSITIDLAVVNTGAIEWARNNSEKWLQDAFGKTYEGVGELIPRAFEEGWTKQDLVRALERYYSPIRAEMIAVTEMTRAATQAELEIEKRLSEITGKHRVPIWLTANDDRRCLECKERHGKPIIDGTYPPLHPRCRCMLAFRSEGLLTPKQKEVWQSR